MFFLFNRDDSFRPYEKRIFRIFRRPFITAWIYKPPGPTPLAISRTEVTYMRLLLYFQIV